MNEVGPPAPLGRSTSPLLLPREKPGQSPDSSPSSPAQGRNIAKKSSGFTLLEMIVTATVLVILASAVVPMAKNGLKRQRELELRRALREMRTAIDNYKTAVEQQRIKPPPPENMGYPESLDILVDGVEVTGRSSGKLRFLRRVPVDPMTGKVEWGMRSTNDDAKSTSWGGGHVFDVYSNSQGTGMNLVPYREW